MLELAWQGFTRSEIQGKKETTGGVIKTKVSKEISTKTNAIIKKEMKTAISIKLPPPWGSKPGFNSLFIYFAKNIHYPASEYDKRIVGNVVVELTVNDGYKITNVKVVNDARPAFADEVVRATKGIPIPLTVGKAPYILGVQFNFMVTEKMTKT